MTNENLDSEYAQRLSGRTAIVTGGANGIGAQTVRLLHSHGANVVIADLPSAKDAAEEIVSSLSQSRILFVPTNILVWRDMLDLFEAALKRFGQVDIVIANAGMMESREFFDLETDENGELKEPLEAFKVIDVNLKGTMNTLRLAMHHMRKNPPDSSQCRGSAVFVASTSGYFGGTGVVSYVASKHGIIGLLRASQKAAASFGIRVNGVAPFFTPTHITGSYAERWKESGLPANRTEDVATAIFDVAVNDEMRGACVLVSGEL
jgi:NAD(P)-dependent dehydrogenase (short-subunit alcohol dehydrogenase family)